ncbi:MAG: hypothetical protein HC902_04200 [Calothrix sp. SM1_5_4]|nr:hypothetical protein [Calothrix sp. SM1_5_4]
MSTRPLWPRFIPIALAVFLATAAVTLFQNCAKGLPDAATSDALSTAPPSDGTTPEFPGLSCKQILASDPNSPSGVYFIDPDGAGIGLSAFQAYCDMSTDGGGWMLVARNNQTTTFTNFDKVWAVYKDGFGDLSGPTSFGWLGNDRLHAMTLNGTELKVANNVRTHLYANFKIDSEANLYRLSVASTATSNDNGVFAGMTGTPFSTSDRDNDTYTSNCAVTYKTGWWHSACYYLSLAGSASNNVYWRGPTGAVQNVTWIEMWIR